MVTAVDLKPEDVQYIDEIARRFAELDRTIYDFAYVSKLTRLSARSISKTIQTHGLPYCTTSKKTRGMTLKQIDLLLAAITKGAADPGLPQPEPEDEVEAARRESRQASRPSRGRRTKG